MRRFLYLAAAVVWTGLGASAFGQGGGMGGGGAGGGAGGGGNGLTGGSGGNSLTGGSGGSTLLGGSGGTSTLGGSGGATRQTGGRTTSGSFAPAQSNAFGGTYANPLYNGRPGSTNLSLTTPGGFGTASYGTTTATNTTGQGNRAGGRATVNSGMNNGTATQNGSATYVTHIAELKFPVAPVVPSALQAELQGQLTRSSMWKGPANVTVEITDGTVVLRGQVADADDRRMAESMVRLTPGVRDVQNEITVPGSPPPTSPPSARRP